MPTLDEVPGARERPGGCRIRIRQSEDGSVTTISIPPREAPAWLVVVAGVFLANLLLVLVTGVALFAFHHSILFMTQIAPHDISPPMRRYAAWFALGWAGLLTLGFWFLVTLVRPLFLRETVTVGPQEVGHCCKVWGRQDSQTFLRSEVRGFHLTGDPQGLVPSVLTLQGRGEEWVIAEYVSDADREWLASVGNALLRGF